MWRTEPFKSKVYVDLADVTVDVDEHLQVLELLILLTQNKSKDLLILKPERYMSIDYSALEELLKVALYRTNNIKNSNHSLGVKNLIPENEFALTVGTSCLLVGLIEEYLELNQGCLENSVLKNLAELNNLIKICTFKAVSNVNDKNRASMWL